MATPADSKKDLPPSSPGAFAHEAQPATPASDVADKVNDWGPFRLQATGSALHCIEKEWGWVLPAKVFTGVAEHLGEVLYGAIRGGQTINNIPLNKSLPAELAKSADDVLGKVSSLSELGQRIEQKGSQILRPAITWTTAKTLEPLFSRAEKACERLMYALSVNSGSIAVANRLLQLTTLIENQTKPEVRVVTSVIFETYLCLASLHHSLKGSTFLGKVVKLGAFLAACECAHRASLKWNEFKQKADDYTRAQRQGQMQLNGNEIEAIPPAPPKPAPMPFAEDPTLQAIADRFPAARTVFWIHRLLSIVPYPSPLFPLHLSLNLAKAGCTHTLGLAIAGTVGGVLGTRNTQAPLPPPEEKNPS